MEVDDTRIRLLFGRFLEKAGLVTSAQVREAMQFKTDLNPSLAETALLEEQLTVEQVKEIRAHQRENAMLFVESAVALEHLDDEKIQSLRDTTKAGSIPVGQALVLKGALSEEQLEEQVEAFHDYNAELAAAREFAKKKGDK